MMEKETKVALSCVGGYFFMIWMTFGKIAKGVAECELAHHGSDYIWRICGDQVGAAFGGVAWPIYWFFKSALWVWGA